MGNVIGSFFSGFSQVIGQLLGHPLDFLSGKSCDSACGPTWDFTCYIENFCVSHLIKLVLVAALVYIVLLFFYLVYKLGICQCICNTSCRLVWACFATFFSVLDFCCTYLCFKLRSVKRKRRRQRRDIELAAISCSSSEGENELEFADPIESRRLQGCSKRRNYKEEQLRGSLKPKNHRARVNLAGNSTHLHKRKSMGNNGHEHVHHHIRVTRTSSFAQKGSRHRVGNHHKRR